MRIGLVVFVIGIALIGLALGTTHAELNPVTMRTEQTRGTPSPIAWITLLAGIGLIIAGYAKRMLAAVESRS